MTNLRLDILFITADKRRSGFVSLSADEMHEFMRSRKYHTHRHGYWRSGGTCRALDP